MENLSLRTHCYSLSMQQVKAVHVMMLVNLSTQQRMKTLAHTWLSTHITISPVTLLLKGSLSVAALSHHWSSASPRQKCRLIWQCISSLLKCRDKLCSNKNRENTLRKLKLLGYLSGKWKEKMMGFLTTTHTHSRATTDEGGSGTLTEGFTWRSCLGKMAEGKNGRRRLKCECPMRIYEWQKRWQRGNFRTYFKG